MNIFVEGLVNIKRRAIVNSIIDENKSYSAFLDEISPIEIYSKAYLDDEKYERFIKKYPLHIENIKENTEYTRYHDEFHIIVDYNNIKDETLSLELKKHNLFGGNFSIIKFMEIIKSKYTCYYGDKNVFENKLFGKIIDEFLMYSNFDDDKIIEFYQDLFNDFKFNCFIYYIEPESIDEVIKDFTKEEIDLFLESLKKSQYGKRNKVIDENDLKKYIDKHIALEKKIIFKVFPNRCRFY